MNEIVKLCLLDRLTPINICAASLDNTTIIIKETTYSSPMFKQLAKVMLQNKENMADVKDLKELVKMSKNGDISFDASKIYKTMQKNMPSGPECKCAERFRESTKNFDGQFADLYLFLEEMYESQRGMNLEDGCWCYTHDSLTLRFTDDKNRYQERVADVLNKIELDLNDDANEEEWVFIAVEFWDETESQVKTVCQLFENNLAKTSVSKYVLLGIFMANGEFSQYARYRPDDRETLNFIETNLL